ncbi:MAG: hypothetical protein HQL75_02830 [Magnetococcales bacterium]|nr:hypothetical protein [Magnetococcales bacterium]
MAIISLLMFYHNAAILQYPNTHTRAVYFPLTGTGLDLPEHGNLIGVLKQVTHFPTF